MAASAEVQKSSSYKWLAGNGHGAVAQYEGRGSVLHDNEAKNNDDCKWPTHNRSAAGTS
jgi:hypothetical protein